MNLTGDRDRKSSRPDFSGFCHNLNSPSVLRMPDTTTRYSGIPGLPGVRHVPVRKKTRRVRTRVTRGRRPEAAIAEAKTFAERMGYRWLDNQYPDLAFDFQIFKPQSIRLVKVRLTWYRIDPDAFYDQLFPDEVRGLRELPFPLFIPRELWLRTQHERAWRRLHVTEVSVGEIEWWGPDDYTNPPMPGDILSLHGVPPRWSFCLMVHLLHARFSVGDSYGWNTRENSPWEVVPTPGKIPFINRCFLKIPV
jgi:hypothetical protein